MTISAFYRTPKAESKPVFYTRMKFPGQEIHVKVSPLPYSTKEVRFECNTLDSEGVIALLLLKDAIERALLPTKVKFFLTLKYFPYARQDRVSEKGEALSVKVMADLINSMKFKQVTVWDPHSDVVSSLLNNVEIVSQAELVGKVFQIPTYRDHLMLVSPDVGASKKINSFAGALPVVIANKKRDTATGRISGVEILKGSSFEETRNLLVVDDICDGGRTFIELGKLLREKWTDNTIGLYVTHGIFSNPEGFKELRSLYTDILVANYIGPEELWGKVTHLK